MREIKVTGEDLRRYRTLVGRAAESFDVHPESLRPDDFLAWLLTFRETTTQSGWRGVKSVCARVMRHLGLDAQDADLIRVSQVLEQSTRMILAAQAGLHPVSRKRVSTELQFENIYRGLVSRFERTLGNPDSPEENHPAAFASWLLTERANWQRSTWGLYRRACWTRLDAERERTSDPEQAARYESAIALLQKSVGEHLCAPKRKTGVRAKAISEAELNIIIEHGRSCRGQWGYRAAIAVMAGIACGLRSAEWIDAEITEDRKYLKVFNAKTSAVPLNEAPAHTAGRGLVKAPAALADLPREAYEALHDYRYVPLGIFGDASRLIEVITEHQEMLKSWCQASGEPPETYFIRCGESLRKLRKRNKGLGNVGMHSPRHQFSANAKNVFTPLGVAYLMGHASDETASEHYGKRRKGWKGITPLDQAVAAIFDVSKVFRSPDLGDEGKPETSQPERQHGAQG